jgi:raffinose/stachyose/melibiose transport system permease protein
MGSELKRNSIRINNPVIVTFNYILLAIITLVVLGPIFIIFNMSFKTDKEYLYSGILELPKNILNLENYLMVIEKGNLLVGFRNTFVLAAVCIVGSIIMGSMVSYILSRFSYFKIIKHMTVLFILPAIIPSVTTQVAAFQVIKSLDLYNTIYAGMILFMGADIIQIYIFLQYMDVIPISLDESANIDGASYFRTFWSIIFPQLMPAIATILILKFVFVYNNMIIPYLYMPRPDLRTVTTALMSFSNDQSTHWNIMGAGIMMVMVPTLLLYLFLQRYILAGATAGSVKS